METPLRGVENHRRSWTDREDRRHGSRGDEGGRSRKRNTSCTRRASVPGEHLEQKLHETIVNALKRADERGIGQIALPPMGAGFYGIPLPVCAEVMVTAIAGYLSASTGIREVIICANDAREYRVFDARLAMLGPPSR